MPNKLGMLNPYYSEPNKRQLVAAKVSHGITFSDLDWDARLAI